jgi:hypothetical protein
MSLSLLGWVIVPVGIALLTVCVSILGGIVKFVQYIARSQAAQEATAKATTNMDTELTQFMTEMRAEVRRLDDRIDTNEKRIAVQDYAITDIKARQSRRARGETTDTHYEPAAQTA